jgi:hypothetical protein
MRKSERRVEVRLGLGLEIDACSCVAGSAFSIALTCRYNSVSSYPHVFFLTDRPVRPHVRQRIIGSICCVTIRPFVNRKNELN